MKYDCEVIQDILPLYVDDICSVKSREIVDSHVEECDSCKEQLKALRNQSVTQILSTEQNRVIKNHIKMEKKRSTTIGIVTAACLMVPLITCLICNLAIGHGLDWFFIVLTSLCILASLTVVPLLVNDNRIMWTLFSCTLSIVALLGTCCIYTGGKWFYIAVVPTVAGLFICFMPYIIRHIELPKVLQNHKAAITMLADSFAVYCIIATAGFYTQYPGYWSIALPITTYGLIVAWIFLGIARYVHIGAMFKAAIITFISTGLVVFTNDIVAFLLDEFDGLTLMKSDLLNWNEYTINGNINWIIIFVGVVITFILVVIGVLLRTNKHK